MHPPSSCSASASAPQMAFRATCRCCLRFHTSRELLRLSVLCKLLLCCALSYYTYKLGYFVGANTRTPELASVLSDPRVLFESIHPRDLRWYAWMTLWSCAGVMLQSAWMVVESLLREERDAGNAVSPKLPLIMSSSKGGHVRAHSMPFSGSTSRQSPEDSVKVRSTALSRIFYTIPIFIFAFSFIKKQHVGTTLVYHPVNSPLLLPKPQPLHLPDLEDFWTSDDDDNLAAASERPSYAVSIQRQEENVVPPIVHFVFGMEATFGGKPFGYAHYLSMYSAMIEIKPDKIMFWHHYLPSTPEKPNWWFDRIQHEASVLGITFEPVLARQFDEIFGNPIVKFAHKADVLRLEALLSYGGIYLDLDVYAIRSFAPLMQFPTVLGLEGGVHKLPIQGLCNGIIVSSPNSTFLRRWYEGYRMFRDEDWAGLSVKWPLKLAKDHPEELLVLDPYAWFYPGWNNNGLRLVHSRQAELSGEGWDFDDSHQFAYHAWSSFTTKKWLSGITPENVFEIETSFNVLVRRWTSRELRRDWKRAKIQGLVS